jgi:DNA-binding beta-propeller fold protein YncE
MTTVVEYPLSVAGLYQYHNVIGLLSGSGPGFSGPVSLALGPDGLLHVASRANPNQPEGVRVTRCTFEGDYIGQFSGWGEAPGQFIWITEIRFGPDGNLYLSDENTHRVSVFTLEGDFLRCWGEFGAQPGQLNRPSGMAFAPNGTLLVVDSLNHRVQRFTADGGFLESWGEEGEGPGQFRMPWGVAVDADGDVYVTDWRNDRVQKFDSDGGYITEFDGRNGGDGFARPNGLTVDPDGRIYVCDWQNDRVQVLDPDGHVIDTLIGHSGTSKWARTFLNANPDIEEKLNAATQNIELKRRFYRPAAVAVSDDGLVFVADCYRHRVQIYQRLG